MVALAGRATAPAEGSHLCKIASSPPPTGQSRARPLPAEVERLHHAGRRRGHLLVQPGSPGVRGSQSRRVLRGAAGIGELLLIQRPALRGRDDAKQERLRFASYPFIVLGRQETCPSDGRILRSWSCPIVREVGVEDHGRIPKSDLGRLVKSDPTPRWGRLLRNGPSRRSNAGWAMASRSGSRSRSLAPVPPCSWVKFPMFQRRCASRLRAWRPPSKTTCGVAERVSRGLLGR